MGALQTASQLASAQPTLEALNSLGSDVVDSASGLARLATRYHDLVSGLKLDDEDQTELTERFAKAAELAKAQLDQMSDEAHKHLNDFFLLLGFKA